MTTVTSSSPSLYAAKAPVVTTLNNIGIEDALKAIRLRPNVKVNISDSVANIKKYLGTLSGIVNNVGTIAQSDAPADALISLTASQYTNYTKVLAKMDASSVSYKLSLSGVTAAAAIAYKNSDNTANRIQSIAVTDSSANIGTNIAGLRGVLESDKLGAITQSGSTTPITLTQASYEANKTVLAKIGTAYTVAMTAATSEQAVGYIANARIGSISITDTTGGVESNLDALQRLGVRLKKIEVSDTGASSGSTPPDAPPLLTNGKIDLTAAQVKNDALVIGKIISSYQLAVHSASLAQSNSLSTNKKVVTIDIVDRGANIVKSLATLNKLGSQLSSVTVTDSDNSLAMTDAQLVTYDNLLGKFSGTSGLLGTDYSIDVAGSSALNAKLLLEATGSYLGSAGAHIHTISIKDTAAHISSYFDGINDQAKLSKVTVLDPKTSIVLTADQLAAAQTAGADSVLGKIAGGYSLKVTDVAAADVEEFLTASSVNAHIAAISVTDDAGAIQGNLIKLTALGGKLDSMLQTDRTATPAVEFELAFDDWNTHKATLQKVIGNYSAKLTGVTAGAAAAVAADSHISAFSVEDTGAEIAKNFDALINVGSRLDEVTQSDMAALKVVNAEGPTLTISAAQFNAGADLLTKFSLASADYALAVNGMTVDQVHDLAVGDQVVSATVLDSSQNIAAHLDDLHAQVLSGLVTHITQQGTASSLGITSQQLANDADALAAITGNYSLTVSGVAVGDAADLLTNNSHVASVGVSGSHDDIAANGALSALKDLGKKLSGITVATGGTVFALTNAEYASFRTTLDKIDTSYTVELSGVTADQVGVLAADTHVAKMSISDTAAHLSAKFDTLKSFVPKIDAINDGAATALTLTASQYALGSALLAKMSYTGTTVKGVTAAVANELADTQVSHLTITDSSANIADNLDALQDNAKVTSITQAGMIAPLSITRTQLADDADTLAKITGSYSLRVSGVAAATVGAVDGAKDLLAHNSKVAAVSVTATAAEIAFNLADLAKLGSKLAGLVQSDPANAINLTDASLVANRAVLDKIDGYRVNVSAVSAARAMVLADDDRVVSLDLTATGAQVSTYFDALKTVLPKIAGINNPSSGTVPLTALALSAVQYAQGGALLAKIGDYTASVKGANAEYAQTLSIDGHVSTLSVADSSGNISDNLDDLAANTKVSGILLEDVSVPLNITDTQRTVDTAALALIAGNWSMNVSGVAAGDAATVDSAAHVASFSVVTDTTDVVGNLTDLAAASKLSSISLSTAGGTLSLPAATLLNASTLATLRKIDNGYSVAVSEATMADLRDLAAIELGNSLVDPPLSPVNVSSIKIVDSSLHLSDQFDDLINLGTQLTELTVVNPAGDLIPLALYYDQWLAGEDTLAKIPTGSYNTVDLFDVPAANVDSLAALDQIDEIYVADYSYNIASQWGALVNQTQLTSITVLDNGDISLTQEQQALAGSEALIGKIQGTYNITDAA